MQDARAVSFYRKNVLSSPGAFRKPLRSGVHNAIAVYDEQRIRERSRLIMYGIDARRQRFPNEKPYVYKPFAGQEDLYRWTPEAKAGLKDYNLQDLGI